MNCRLKEREKVSLCNEFKAYALAEVRRLRTLEIEVAVRLHTGNLTFASPKE